jgi:hypothetical protein
MSASAIGSERKVDGNRLAKPALAIIGLLAIVHLGLGSSLPTTLSTMVCLSAGLIAVGRLGWTNLNTYLVQWFVLITVGLSALIKPLLGESLDAQLTDPEGSFTVVAISVVLFTALALLAEGFRSPVRLFHANEAPRYLRSLSWIAFGVGTLLFVASSLNAQEDENGLRIFRETIFPVAVAARVMYLAGEPKEPVFDVPLLLFFGVSIALVMFSGQKGLFVSCGLVYLATLLRFRHGIPWGAFALLGIGVVAMVMVFGPLINTLRYRSNLNSLGAMERVSLTVTSLFDGTLVTADAELAEIKAEGWIPRYWGEMGGGTHSVAERIMLVASTDAIKPAIDHQGPLPAESLLENVWSQVPRMLNPNKQTASNPADKIMWYIRARHSRAKEGFPAIGIIGGAYGLGGFWGYLLWLLVAFTVFFIAQSLIADHRERNLWSVVFACLSIKWVFEYDPFSSIFAMLRQLPILCVAWYVCHLLAKLFSGSSAQSTTKPIAQAGE